jgi:hypothetical protein
MIALPPPYGLDSPAGTHITLATDRDTLDEDALETVLLSYSCHQPAIPKIKTCLRHGKRYDCILAAGWFRGQQQNVIDDLAALGVRLTVNFHTRDLH